MDMEALGEAVEQRRNNDVHATWGYHSRVVESHRLLCVSPPKNGCTATKRVLLGLEDPSWCSVPPDRFAEVHDAGVTLDRFDTHRICELLTSPEWLRFAFVRNPYHRLFSAYKSKIGNTWDRQYDWLREDIRGAFGYPSSPGERKPMVSFADYVRYVTATEDPRVMFDGHIDQQVNILAPELIRYDTLGRFESFRTDLTSVLERIGAPPSVLALVVEKVNPTVNVPLPFAYDNEIADLVHTMYQVDFDAFGYARDSWRFG